MPWYWRAFGDWELRRRRLWFVDHVQPIVLRTNPGLQNSSLSVCASNWCFRPDQLRGALISGRNNRRDEPISPSGYGLYESRLLRVIFQDLSNLADCAPDAVVCVQKDIGPPNPGHDFLTSNDLAWALEQQQKNLQRNPLQLQHTAAAT
jgi:hypothetical protein